MSRVVTPERPTRQSDKPMTPKGITRLAIGLLIFVFVVLGVIAYGYVWYRTTGFIEQNQVTFKPQELASPASVPGAIPITGSEPILRSRALARQLVNPIPASEASVKIGKDLFFTYCEPCHGWNGNGQKGIMGAVPPLSLVSQKENDELAKYLAGYMSFTPDIDMNFVQRETVGELFLTVTNGGEAIMPSFKDALSPEQRWHLVNYIKTQLGGADE